MKQSILFSMLLLFAAASFSQTQKGSVLLGTTANLTGGLVAGVSGVPNQAGFAFATTKYKSGTNSETSEWTIFNFSPNVAYFAMDGLAIGASINFARLKGDEGNVSSFGSAAPFVRYYFLKAKKMKPFMEVSGGMVFQKEKEDDETERTKQPFFAGKLGTAFFVNQRLSLDLFVDGLFMQKKEDDPPVTTKSTTKMIGFGLGLAYFLR